MITHVDQYHVHVSLIGNYVCSWS